MKPFVVSYMTLTSPTTPDIKNVSVDYERRRDEIAHMVEEAQEHNQGKACAWFQKPDGEIITIITIPRAEEIRNHMVKWSEEKIEKWFILEARFGKESDYGFWLRPNLVRTLERWKINYQLLTGFPVQVESARFIFCPVQFYAKHSKIAESVRGFVGQKATVYLMDDRFSSQLLQNIKRNVIDEDLMHRVGVFTINESDTVPME